MEIRIQKGWGIFLKIGGDKGIRTPDLRIANASLYQLSYIPKGRAHYGIKIIACQQ